MSYIRLGFAFCSVLTASIAIGGCEQTSPTPDALAPLERMMVIREQVTHFSLECAELTAEHRAVLEGLAELGYVIDVSAYAPLPPNILTADLASLAEAIAEVDAPSRAVIEQWIILPGSESLGAYKESTSGDFISVRDDDTLLDPLEEHELSFPYKKAFVRLEGRSPLPIVLLPRFTDLAASVKTDTTKENTIVHAIASSELWAAAFYFLPQKNRIVQYNCAMPKRLFDGQLGQVPKGGPPVGPLGKIIGRPDDDIRQKTSFLSSAQKVEKKLSSREILGVVTTGEMTPTLWTFAAWEPSDAEGHATRQGFAVPLLDGNGAMRGTSFFDVTPTRGSAFENLVLDVPENLTWGRHALYKLPRPMALARYGMSEEMRARTHLEERIVALIPSDETLVPPIQAFVKAETWGPFAEDVVLTANPTAEQLASGAVRVLAISASIEPGELLRLLTAMAGHDQIESPTDLQSVPENDSGP